MTSFIFRNSSLGREDQTFSLTPLGRDGPAPGQLGWPRSVSAFQDEHVELHVA